MTSNTEKRSVEGKDLTLPSSSRPATFPFERLSAELRVKVYEFALISPCGWFNITWDWNNPKVVRPRLSLTEELSQTELLGKICISMLYLNKRIHQEACEILYGSNLFHFDVPVDDDRCWIGPHPDHNVITFLSSLSEASRGFIRSIRIYIATRRLENLSPRSGWPFICRYLASKIQLRHLAIVVVNNCSGPQEDVENMQDLCKMENPWAKYLAWISGLESFTLHTARCPCRDNPFEVHDRCPTTLPLLSEVVLSFNETHQWTAEDRANGLIIKEEGVERSKNCMTRHLERHHFSPFYGEPLGACISRGFKEQLRTELGIESSAHVAEA